MSPNALEKLNPAEKRLLSVLVHVRGLCQRLTSDFEQEDFPRKISGEICRAVILTRAKDPPLAAASHKVVGVIATAIVGFLALLGMTIRGDFSREINGEISCITFL